MSAYVSPTNWGGIKATLLGDENNPGIDNEYAELIIALLQMAENRNPDISPRILELADELKLLSIQDLRRLNAELVNIAQAIGAPSKFISVTEQNVKWWRTFTTYLFGAGVAIAVINAFVPIQFGLIAQTVFATGLDAARVFFSAFSGTSAPATAAAADAVAAAAAAAAAGTGPSMVAGPDLGALKLMGVTIYALSIVALTKCAGIVVSVVSAAASAACSLMTIPNAEKVADLAVQAVTIAGLTVGLDKGSDFIVRFYRGDFDAAIAAMIDQGIFDAAQNAAINTFLEAIKDIDDNKIGIRWNQGSAYSRDFKPSHRQLDVHIMDIILGTFDESLVKLGETSWLGSRGDIMSNLSALDRDPNAIIRLKNKYGMQILILYMLLSQKAKKAKPGFGSHESGTSSQEDAGSGKSVKMHPSSLSMPPDRKEPVGTNPYIVDYNLKTQILRATGYINENDIQFVYIPDFQGSMSKCMEQVLGCLYDENVPHMGNIFTAISRLKLPLERQNSIRTYILGQCGRNFLPLVENEVEYETHIQAIATKVRPMLSRALVDIRIPTTSLFKTATAATAATAAIPATDSLKKVKSETATATGTLGGRKSRRYKKRKATLKRRRIRRRSTRKGRKRRYTKRR